MTHRLDPRWNLAPIFPGGSQSLELEAHMKSLTEDLAAFAQRVAATTAPMTAAEAGPWSQLLLTMQELGRRLREASAFIHCHLAADMKDQRAKLLSGRVRTLAAALSAPAGRLDSQLIAMAEPAWAALLADPEFAAIRFNLEERRVRAAQKLDPEREALIGDLGVDGYQAWNELYNIAVSRTQIKVQENGEERVLSPGQAANRMTSGDRAMRVETFAAWEEGWREQSEICAAALNHLAGFRLQTYKHRGWETAHQEPLEYNRMTAQTLSTMWDVIDRNKDRLVTYLEAKAKLLGLERLSWHDLSAPLGADNRKVSYEEAAAFIVEHFQAFNPAMAAYAQMAFDQRWIEVEDRPGKRPGGFCTSFPLAQQSRIFMTFAGTTGNVSTLAHELGHGYHQYVMNDLPPMAQGYAMNVAETASTFAELIVGDAALKAATGREARLVQLDGQLKRTVSMFMDIHSRFLFETEFYEQRRKGMLDVEQLDSLMLSAQKKAFCGALGEYHPLFWASKLHFYNTGVPFYNFPYTFGFLFSTGVYARALAQGPSFADRYVALLRDTGSMRVEDLALRHLGADLTMPAFWQASVDLALGGLDEFLALARE